MSAVQRLLGTTQRALSRMPGVTLAAAKIRNQCNMIISTALTTGSALEASGETWLADAVAPGARYFVDVGANVGEWTAMFAGRMRERPAGLLVEPNPAAAERLRTRVAGEGRTGCEVLAAAAGERPDRLPFFAEEYCGETSSLHRPSVRVDFTVVEVDVVTLDQALADRKVDHVDMLKVDAEGHDFRVIQGAEGYLRAQRIDVLQFEYNKAWLNAGSTLARAFEFLDGLGYATRLLRKDGLADYRIEAIGDFFNYSNFVAFRRDGLRPDLQAALRRTL